MDGILPLITAPGLQALTLTMRGASGHDLLAFIRRSSPPLEKLIIGTKQEEIVAECLNLLPTLTHFEICELDCPPTIGDYFCTMLADNPSMVPNLRVLKFGQYDYTPSGQSLDLLLHCIAVRSTMLRTVHIIGGTNSQWQPRTNPRLEAALAAGLREFLGKGVDIRIGSPEKNFLDL
ncbi:hypothetical protein FB45DRAFT_1022485 [Roridomyces roridus]|uniref:Uncharacterized protein n=1 Tax=Roridomyces roridus TaxID=1738132 RepID=A0AAD7C8S4_9AGAR|nr:hypothetical protein FB45DRAFT_1022485 [Roridomyces roridus]